MSRLVASCLVRSCRVWSGLGLPFSEGGGIFPAAIQLKIHVPSRRVASCRVRSRLVASCLVSSRAAVLRERRHFSSSNPIKNSCRVTSSRVVSRPVTSGRVESRPVLSWLPFSENGRFFKSTCVATLPSPLRLDGRGVRYRRRLIGTRFQSRFVEGFRCASHLLALNVSHQHP